MLTDEIIEFIRLHEADPPEALLLSASRYPGVDMPFVADQILARRQVKEKLPRWYAERRICYPSRLAAEQCSSEATARYKQSLVAGETLCDLTGGLGVDSYYFSRCTREVFYVERHEAYCRAARHNFQILEASNIQLVCGDAGEVAEQIAADTYYLDPARRKADSKRAFALSDYEPDPAVLLPLLLPKAKRVIIKISPMADLTHTLRLFPQTVQIHVVAVKNECKELLFVLEPGEVPEIIPIHTVNLTEEHTHHHLFFREKEAESRVEWATAPGRYLYEPHAAILKAGAFRQTAARFNLQKLHPHSHLYTSDRPEEQFPGRIFEVEAVIPFSSKTTRQLAQRIPQAHITPRNFPLTTAELRKRSGIREGGDLYLFATTLCPQERVWVVCRKASFIKKPKLTDEI